MCGVVGVVEAPGTWAEAPLLERMADAVRHRGPDDSGVYTHNNVGLGHRRLAIIDLSPDAAQPMLSSDGRYALSYNGELYNYRELRTELVALGHRFRTRSDTEVVLQAFVEWGAACVELFDGMFAFAAFDGHTHRLVLARDRFGVKPLYLGTTASGRILFGSEIKALLAGGLPAALDYGALAEYLTFQNLLSQRTLFRDVSMLPAGSVTVIDAETATLEPSRRYWHFDFSRSEPITAEACAEELLARFRAAVRRQLMSDVPVGALLSGGMDSGSITAVAAKERELYSITGGFDLRGVSGVEAGFDERADARLVADSARTRHYERELTSDDMPRCFDVLIRHLEDPRAGMCWQNYLVAELASHRVKVLLSGTGGDELFAGYPWRYAHARRADFAASTFAYWQRLIPVARHAEVLVPEVAAEAGDSVRAAFDAVLARCPATTKGEGIDLGRALGFEAQTFLHGLFVVDDKVTMAHSVESRVPFLDNALVDFAQRIPAELLLSADGRTGKVVLRRALAGLLPDRIRDNRKQGFSPPDAEWYRGPSRPFVRERLLGRGQLASVVQEPALRRILEQHESGAVNHRLLIWSLLCVESWMSQFLALGSRGAP